LPSSRRPRLVTWLSLGVLSLSVLFLARLVLGLRLPDLHYTVPRWYIPLSGGVWGALALGTALGLLTGRPWASPTARFGAILFAAWYWADRLLFVHTEYARRSLPAAAALTLAGLGFTFWALTRPHARTYFGRPTDERRLQD